MIHAILLLDESGSMTGVKNDVVGGYNSYLKELKKGKNKEDIRLSLYTFDSSGEYPIVREKLENQPLTEVRRLSPAEYNPRGMTPLNDAVLWTIKHTKGFILKEDTVIFSIYTDGLENTSIASALDVKKKIEKCKNRGWEFIYLGANQDAWSVGGGYGIQAAGHTFTTSATGQGTRAMLRTSANMINTVNDAVNDGIYSVGEGGTLAANFGKTKEIEEEELKPDDAA